MTSGQGSLFLYDLGVLEHGDAAALGHFALQRDRFAAELSQLIVYRLVFADHEIRFAVAYDPDRAAAFDALLTATGVLLAYRVVVDIAHHVDDLASHFFRRRIGLLRLCRQRQRGRGQRGRESQHDSDFHKLRNFVSG